MPPRKKKVVPQQDGTAPAYDPNPSIHLPYIASLFQSIQRARVGLELSLQTRENFVDPSAMDIHEELVNLEKSTVRYLKQECSKASIYPWLVAQRGISDRVSGMLIGLIDIRKAPTVSSLWRYAGQAVVYMCPAKDCATETFTVTVTSRDGEKKQVQKSNKVPTVVFSREAMDAHLAVCVAAQAIIAEGVKKGEPVIIEGKAERRVKGMRLHYNMALKKTCYLAGRQFIRHENPVYEPVYREARAWYDQNRPTWSDGRRHNSARRKMVKLFLSHMWTVWRELEHLPVRLPYAQTLSGHEQGYIPPPVMPAGKK